MKNNGRKSDLSHRYHTRVIANIIYSTLVACLIDVFLVTNLTMLAEYAKRSEQSSAFLNMVAQSDVVVVLVYVLVGILVFAVTFLLLQEKSAAYISHISDAIERISDGDLNTQVEVVGDDEFSSMASNLNKMVEDIRRLMDKERESERTKNELITNVAHDLRTPLTSIIGYLELLSGPVVLPPEMQKKYIDIAYSKAKRLEKLIEDLFGFTKMNYGKLAMHVSKVDIVKLLGQLLEESYPNFANKGLSYELQSNVPAKMITADGNLLARLFDNLIGNAIKYMRAEEPSFISMRIKDVGDFIQVEIEDNGKGISNKDLPYIFDRFYRADASRNSAAGGSGIGLSIVKKIIEDHGGKIWATSKENVGTVMYFVLRKYQEVPNE